MSVPGFMGTVLYVDLSRGSIRREPLDPALPRHFLGGDGINSRLAYDLIPPRVDPLSEENCLILGAGPLVGTHVPGAAKIMITTKFPLSGAFATASGGGAFALMMKLAGYDHVVIGGRAPRPVYLNIDDDHVELCDASDLWGRDAFETVDALRQLYEPCSVIPIGPAGENLVKISVTSIDKAGSIGRGGLPAVMGAKNLKAIVVRGSREVTVAEQADLTRIVNQTVERMMRWAPRQYLIRGGIWGMGVAAEADHTNPEGEAAGEALRGRTPMVLALQRIHLRNRQPLSCPSCPLADKEIVHVREGEYAGLVTYMTHFEPYLFGATDPLEAYGQAIKHADALNRLGIDFSTFPQVLSAVVQLYDQGTIAPQHTDGFVPRQDFATTMKLLRMTAYREGLGDVLAEGFGGLPRRFGAAAERQGTHVKGHGIVYDPRLRGLGTMEFEQVVNFRGSHVASGGSPAYEPGRPVEDFRRHADRMGADAATIERAVGPDGFNLGRYLRISENWFSLFNSLGLCNRAQLNRFWSAATLADIYSAVTGMPTAKEALMAAAERVWTLGKLLNVRAGFSRADDRPPAAWFTPLPGEGREHELTDYYHTRTITPADFEHFLDEYYDERGWDLASGVPTPEALARVGLADLTP